MAIQPTNFTLIDSAVAVTPSNADGYSVSAYRDFLFNVAVSEPVISGNAVVAIEYYAPVGGWQELESIEIDNTSVAAAGGITLHIPALPIRKVRARVTSYTALTGAEGAVEISVGLSAG